MSEAQRRVDLSSQKRTSMRGSVVGKPLDLGHGHTAALVTLHGELMGADVSHTCRGFLATHWIPFNGTSAITEGWRLINADPLTIEPSLQCLQCPDHGFIRDGKWVPA